MGDMGGLFDALMFVGVFVLGNFTTISLFSILLPQLFVQDQKM